MNIVLLGPPGSGKGTQAEMLSDHFNLYYLQTGDLARELAEKDTRINEIIDSGKLIPEEEMTAFVMKHLEKNVPEGRNILFEGFPRFVHQYQVYEKWLASKGEKIDKVILLDIAEEDVVKRLSARRICSKCDKVYNLITNPPPEGKCECGGELVQRDDDNPNAIKVRFDYYRKNTKLLADYLKDKGSLIIIDANRPINVIFEEIVQKLNKKGLA